MRKRKKRNDSNAVVIVRLNFRHFFTVRHHGTTTGSQNYSTTLYPSSVLLVEPGASTSIELYRTMFSTPLTRASLLWSRLKLVPSEHPFAFGVIISGIKTSFSDLLVQKVVERKEQIDWKRNAAFASFGFVYLGGVQYMIYVPFFGRLFPRTAAFVAKPFLEKVKDTRGILGTLAQVFLDQAVHHPFMYFPAFYITVRTHYKQNQCGFTPCLTMVMTMVHHTNP